MTTCVRAVTLACAVGVSLVATDASAATIRWRAAVNGSWSSAASWEGNAVPGATDAVIAALPGVKEFELRGDRVAISSADSDATLWALKAAVPAVHDVEISAVGLEGAFLSLTADETAEPVR